MIRFQERYLRKTFHTSLFHTLHIGPWEKSILLSQKRASGLTLKKKKRLAKIFIILWGWSPFLQKSSSSLWSRLSFSSYRPFFYPSRISFSLLTAKKDLFYPHLTFLRIIDQGTSQTRIAYWYKKKKKKIDRTSPQETTSFWIPSTSISLSTKKKKKIIRWSPATLWEKEQKSSFLKQYRWQKKKWKNRFLLTLTNQKEALSAWNSPSSFLTYKEHPRIQWLNWIFQQTIQTDERKKQHCLILSGRLTRSLIAKQKKDWLGTKKSKDTIQWKGTSYSKKGNLGWQLLIR